MPRTLTVCCCLSGGGCSRVAKLMTRHLCVIHIPGIITHGVPYSMVKDFHAAVVTSATHQTNVRRTIRARYTGVIAMTTSIVSTSIVSTVVKVWLTPWACHVTYPYWTSSLTVRSTAISLSGFREAKLPAHHVSIIYIPTITANGAPLATIFDFNSSSWCRMTINTDAFSCCD